MDRQARKLAIIRSSNLSEEGTAPSDHGSEGGSNTDSDSDDKVSNSDVHSASVNAFLHLKARVLEFL